MNAIEFTQLVDRIEALWPGRTWLEQHHAAEVYEKFKSIDIDAASEAVDLAFSDGRDYPPSPPRLASVARNIQRRHREARAIPEDTGPREGIEGFARRHDGYTPSQIAKAKAGLDPGVPAFPGFARQETS